MADECTDVTTIEELTICCRWVESGVSDEHFIEIFPLKKANAESIYSALVEYCREKNIQLGRLIGMGFDGAATFPSDKTQVKRRSKEFSPHALFVHCHVLQLELLTNDKRIGLFPNLHKLATICLSIPISTASVERSFSDIKLIRIAFVTA